MRLLTITVTEEYSVPPGRSGELVQNQARFPMPEPACRVFIISTQACNKMQRRNNVMTPRQKSLVRILVWALFMSAFPSLSHALTCAAGSGPTITVQPGDDVQSKVTSAGCGATFLFKAGVYNNFSVVPLDYDQFISTTPKGAILS